MPIRHGGSWAIRAGSCSRDTFGLINTALLFYRRQNRKDVLGETIPIVIMLMDFLRGLKWTTSTSPFWHFVAVRGFAATSGRGKSLSLLEPQELVMSVIEIPRETDRLFFISILRTADQCCAGPHRLLVLLMQSGSANAAVNPGTTLRSLSKR